MTHDCPAASPPTLGSGASAWIRRATHKPGARTRLICLPHAGGSGLAFADWGSEFGPGVEVHTVTLPGRGYRLLETPETRMAPLARGLADALRENADMPYVLFGHSMGALLAYAVARRQAELGLRAPQHLFVAAACPPHAERPTPPLHLRSDADLLDCLRELGGMPAELLADEEMARLILPAIRADLAACENYRPTDQALLDCPLTVFAGTGDPLAPVDQLRQWQRYVRARFTLHQLAGDHFFVHASRRLVVARICEALDSTRLR